MLTPLFRLGRGLRGLAVPALLLLLAAPALAASPQSEEIVPLGESRERPIAAGEKQDWRVVVPPETTVLVTVEQRSIDLVVEARKPEDKEPFAVTAGRDSWGVEVLLLDNPGETRITIRSRETSSWPGRYSLRVEIPSERTGARRDALDLMSRAGRETLPDTPGSREQAEATYRQAVAAWRALGDRAWEAEALTSIGILESEASELPAASADCQSAIDLWEELGKPQREAAALNQLGLVVKETQGIEKIRPLFERAVALWHELREPFDESASRTNLCYVEQKQGSLPSALACYQENLAFFQKIGAKDQAAVVLNNIGGIHDSQGEPDLALGAYGQASAIWRSLGNRLFAANALNNIGVVHRTLGELEEALRVFGESRELAASLEDRDLLGTILNNVGFLYLTAEEPQRAVFHLENSLTLRRQVGKRVGEILTLNNLGTAWRKLGNLEKALDQHRQALALANALGSASQQAICRLRLAEVDLEQGNAAAALQELATSLPILRKTADRRNQVDGLFLEGRALALAGQTRAALPVFQEALTGRRDLRDRAGEAETLAEMARAERSLGLTAEALAHAEAAVGRVEEVRTALLRADLRVAFLAARRRSFSLLIDLLMDRHAADPGARHDREAFAVSERVHARSLLDVLRTGSAGHTAKAISPDLLAQRNLLLRRLSGKIDRRWKESGPRAEGLDQEIDAILAEMDTVESRIRGQDRRFAEFSAPKPVSLEEVSGWLEPGTTLLEYSLGEDRSFLWVLDAGRLRSFSLPPQREIEALARQVYEETSSVESGGANRRKAAETLSRILIGPLWSDPNAAAALRRLVVVPDGALAILPFAALPIPDRGRTWERPGALHPLLERLEVVSIPSATTFGAQRQQGRAPAAKWAAVFADPVFAADDPRLGRQAAARSARPRDAPTGSLPALRGGTDRDLPRVLERLPGTRREAEVLAALAPHGMVKLDLGLDANRDAALATDLRDYRVVHFATHALADIQNPELSGLVLSQVDAEGHPREGFLGLSDIYELDLDADLVVLSGCRTALGKEVRGEGVMGLTRGFQYAGVPRVLASLWPVQDRATAELMTRFYRAMWRDHQTPAAALREAQLALRREARYRDPHSWAGFVLQGDWH
ncbi:MAG TPA: CHAT domain-containing tetratricopeptide repeat protein [Thermoanaerobaculia bacterium]|nr:CHAT domain-containing tetratricopeptide repeat protein [Thermoanaerobaculia bacterium]